MDTNEHVLKNEIRKHLCGEIISLEAFKNGWLMRDLTTNSVKGNSSKCQC
ncbi:hypothetical protein KQY60_000903 [Listeria monocytogenes]|nr:hypothetical protein [Listeria monocytogenes]EHQ5030945.1 hypothetical protein [Listeria monocytogenes]EIE5833167.1 hypothetical protein [Listeria monocytogenes]EII3201676.1 hypothetical protein [Listeria monocytogenes]EII3207517.1 hypothetical protein [Listeria monocytogenes]